MSEHPEIEWWVEAAAYDALSAKLEQAERSNEILREQNMVLLGNREDAHADIARLTRELDLYWKALPNTCQIDHPLVAHANECPVCALREVVEAAKAFVRTRFLDSGPQVAALCDALATLAAKEEK